MEIIRFIEEMKRVSAEAANDARREVNNGKIPEFISNLAVYVGGYVQGWQFQVSRLEYDLEQKRIIFFADDDGPWYASTRWCKEDILGAADTLGLKMSKEEATGFLQENSRHIVDMMIRAGNETIETGLLELNLPKKEE